MIHFLILSLLLVVGGAQCYFCAQDKEDAHAEYLQTRDHLDEQQEKETAAEIKRYKGYGKFLFIAAAIVLAIAFMV